MRLYKKLAEENMGPKYKCDKCGWVYDPEKVGKPFSEQPNTYKCPECGVPKLEFTKI